jgi:hypothetical protein
MPDIWGGRNWRAGCGIPLDMDMSGALESLTS